MKEMPERIYLFDCNDAMATPLEGDTEYIRKDFFIKKACKFLKEHREEVRTEDNGISGWIPERFIEDFKEYMNENS